MLLILASHNKHKKQEIEKMLPEGFEIKDLNDLDFHEEIEETGNSFEENALIKARYLHSKMNCNCIGEDSGLEVASLNGEPGIYTARFAAKNQSPLSNMQLLLSKLKNQSNRKANFRTVIALIYNDREYIFEGQVEGSIAKQESGSGGFGYDPIFIPEHYEKTFAELESTIKTNISHRSRAVKKLLDFLSTQK
jgi:XTP/dITP diphosphohydrolase